MLFLLRLIFYFVPFISITISAQAQSPLPPDFQGLQAQIWAAQKTVQAAYDKILGANERQSVGANTVSATYLKELPENCLERRLYAGSARVDQWGVPKTDPSDAVLRKVYDGRWLASSEMTAYRAPNAKLGQKGNAWRPLTDDKTQFIQVDLGQMYRITAIGTQGCNSEPWWVTTFQLQYSVDGQTWQDYMDPKRKTVELIGNSDQDTIVKQPLVIIHARWVKLWPTNWREHISMRFDMYGCDDILGPQGHKGEAGNQGAKGSTGIPGQPGVQGPRGEVGLKGQKGPQGYAGLTGPVGDRGLTGLPGQKGPKGDQGDIGYPGLVGPQGAPGLPGLVGEPGALGLPGLRGIEGDPGEPGKRGSKGQKGDQGEKGFQGDAGTEGRNGILGPPGDPGATGRDGTDGIMGPRGSKGPDGDTGLDGVDGRMGPKGPQGSIGGVENTNRLAYIRSWLAAIQQIMHDQGRPVPLRLQEVARSAAHAESLTSVIARNKALDEVVGSLQELKTLLAPSVISPVRHHRVKHHHRKRTIEEDDGYFNDDPMDASETLQPSF